MKLEKKSLFKKQSWQDASFFFIYLKPYLHVFIPAMIVLAMMSGMMLLFMMALSDMVIPISKGLNGSALYDHAKQQSFKVIALAGVMAFAAFWRIFLFAKTAEKALAKLRFDTFAHLMKLPFDVLNQHRLGELGSRIASDLECMREVVVLTLPMLIRHLVIILSSIVMIVWISYKLALCFVVTLPVVLVLIAIFGSKIRKRSKISQDALAASQVVVQEGLQSMFSVKAFRNEGYESKRYQHYLEIFTNCAVKAALPRASFVAFVIFSFSSALVLIIVVAMYFLSQGELTVEELAYFSVLSILLSSSFQEVPDLFSQVQKMLGATERVRELFSEKEEQVFGVKKEKLIRFKGDIIFDRVNYTYASRPEVQVLTQFSFEAKSGQKIALVGPSGSGKSTMVSLLYRFYEGVEGEIKIDGKRIQDYSLDELRSNMAIVPQEVLLFGGSILENIAYGNPEASREEVIEAAIKANAHHFITELPQGYDTLVGDRGAQLSGGQRQRIAIARAILANPTILILDEATSSLDAESEHAIQQALQTLMNGRTTIVIAHRLATIRDADLILVVSGGTVIEQGKHEVLVADQRSLYHTLTKLQFNQH
jgi:ATP-binding cassette subfamily B protein